MINALVKLYAVSPLYATSLVICVVAALVIGIWLFIKLDPFWIRSRRPRA